MQYNFPTRGGVGWGGWGSKAVWSFSENSSILVNTSLPRQMKTNKKSYPIEFDNNKTAANT